MRPDDDPTAIIEVVCTGNICRSPYAQALLRSAAADRLDHPSLVRVLSCGIAGLEGEAASDGTLMEAARRGLDLTGHAGARWTEERMRVADIVITMSATHRTHITDRVEGTSAKTFTIRELVRLASHVDTADDPASPRERIRRFAVAANAARPFVSRPREPEDVDDPYGGPPEGYARMAAQVDRLVLALVDHLLGPLPDVDHQLFDRR